MHSSDPKEMISVGDSKIKSKLATIQKTMEILKKMEIETEIYTNIFNLKDHSKD